ncbi:MAG: hypothetical protein J2P31_02140 [Blastocatellia bacterium]|nr:hypothetical protein [Blastocatellia bacterium]
MPCCQIPYEACFGNSRRGKETDNGSLSDRRGGEMGCEGTGEGGDGGGGAGGGG